MNEKEKKEFLCKKFVELKEECLEKDISFYDAMSFFMLVTIGSLRKVQGDKSAYQEMVVMLSEAWDESEKVRITLGE